MKKLFAILLAALLLLNVGALAEGHAATLTANNIRVEAQGQKIVIPGMDFILGLDNVNGLPSIVLLIDDDGQRVFTALGQLTSRQFNFATSGMSNGYYALLPAEAAGTLAQVGDAGLAMMLPQLLPGLDQIALPPFTGVDVPKVELSDLLSAYITSRNGDSYDFEIPYEEVYRLLDQFLRLAREQGTNVDQVDEALQTIEQLKAMNMGFELKGNVADSGSTLTATADVYLVQNGVASPGEVATIILTSSQNNFRVGMAVTENGVTVDVLNVTLVSDPAAATLDFDMNIANEIRVAFDLFSEDGLQKAVLGIDGAEDDSMRFEFDYGRQGGRDVVILAFNAQGVRFELSINSVMGANNVRTGEMNLAADYAGSDVLITADIEMRTDGTLDVGSFSMPTDLRPFDQMDSDAFVEAFNPVIERIQSHVQMG